MQLAAVIHAEGQAGGVGRGDAAVPLHQNSLHRTELGPFRDRLLCGDAVHWRGGGGGEGVISRRVISHV